ncbi:hypothetical protein XENOCAPTIV_014483 [Xenoophorus captivus]|uniref:CUB domain-containing protein n=1 Tax=Xenoophorus captivus TaxID=1517983 RepID=A0ABV0RKX6_9TELE
MGCSSINCNVVLTEAQGEFKSPCYPQKYPNAQTCKWTLQAPAGFIIQLSFLDFELEEAQNCMYDWVMVNTGNTESKFCGLTASGLTLNSTRNVMEISFVSDFTIQKKGFMKEWLFTYYDTNNNVALSFGYNQTGMQMVIDGVICPVESIISAANFTSSMKPFCVLWTSSNGRVAVYFNGNYLGKTCSPSSGHNVTAGGVFQLGGAQHHDLRHGGKHHRLGQQPMDHLVFSCSDRQHA